MDCILLRHGEPEGPGQIYLGHTDPPLSVLGKQQCVEACRWWRDYWPEFKPEHIYSSQLQRAIDSAAAIKPHYEAVPFTQHVELNEINFGAWDGLAFDEVEQHTPGALERWLQDPLHEAAPGGETFYDMDARVRLFLEAHDKSPCIIVAHYCSIAVLAAQLLGIALSHADRLALKRGCCGRIKDGELLLWGMPS